MEELNTFHRICPLSGKSCRQALCEHQCFMDEQECRKPEPQHHHHKKELSEEMWDELMKKLSAMPAFVHSDRTEYWHIVNKQLEIIGDLARAQDRPIEITMIERPHEEEHHHRKHRNKPIFALTTIINKQKFIYMADVQLVVGSPKTGIFTLIDNKTLLPITTASFSNQAVGANSNPEFASFALDTANPNNLIGTPIAAGSGTVVITTDASWTDAGDNSSQSGSFSVTKNYTVTPSADGASFDVVFP